MITLKIKKKRTGPVINRHPWVFSQALENIPDDIRPGTPVGLLDENGKFLASGYFNSYSQIAIRIWGYEEHEEVNKDFFATRIIRAYKIRKRYIESADTDSYRLINGENDLLPGLIVDKYGAHLVIQFHTGGIESWKDVLVQALVDVIRPAGIFEKSDTFSRGIENLQSRSGLLFGEIPALITIKENGFKFLVDVRQGQKTGFFLDQRDKRQALGRYVKDKHVLNCFSYTGAFSVYALAGGAQRVVSVDTSASSLELAKENIKLNKLDIAKCEFVCDDVKKYLKNVEEGKFNLIILDPPAFVKDRKKKKEGLIGYRNINEAALRILSENGILITCSCSAHVSLQDFRYLLVELGGRVKKSLQVLETYTHGIDHPELAPFIEGEYLKCFFVMT